MYDYTVYDNYEIKSAHHLNLTNLYSCLSYISVTILNDNDTQLKDGHVCYSGGWIVNGRQSRKTKKFHQGKWNDLYDLPHPLETNKSHDFPVLSLLFSLGISPAAEGGLNCFSVLWEIVKIETKRSENILYWFIHHEFPSSFRCADGFGGERCDMKTPTTYNHSSMYSTNCEPNKYLGGYYCWQWGARERDPI